MNGVPRGGYEPDKNNFAPRIALAWSPGESRRTVVRTGYSIHYNTSSLATGQGIYFNPPFFNFQLFFPSQQSVIQIHDPWPAGGAAPVPPSATTYDRNLTTSYAQQWNFTLQREAAPGIIENVYRVQIMNTDETPRRYTIRAEGLPELEVVGVEQPIALNGAEARPVALRLQAPVESRQGERKHDADRAHDDERKHREESGELRPGAHKIEFVVQAVEDERVMRHEKSSFIVPR